MKLATFPIAGWKHYTSLEDLSIMEGDIALVHEPNNQFDPDAVMVKLGSHQIGYLPKPINQVYLNLKAAGALLYATRSLTDLTLHTELRNVGS